MKTRSAVVALAIVGFVAPVTAQGSDNATVDVTVNEVTRVDINPTSLGYGGSGNLGPKTFNATSDNGFVGIQVENSGSNNITQASVQNSQPLSRPFGTGLADNYDAGNFIKMRPDNSTDFTIGVGGDGTIGSTDTGEGDSAGGTVNSDPTGYHYGARVDFNATGPPTGTPQALTYITVPQDGEDYRYGRFREGDEEFFWVIELRRGDEGDGNICDGTGASGNTDLFVGNKPHTDEAIGTVDFTDDNSDEFAEYQVVSNPNDGSGDFGRVDGVELNTSQGNTTYTVLSWCGPTDQDSVTVDSGNADAADKTFLTRTRYDLRPFADTTPSSAPSYPTTEGLNTTGAGTDGVQRLVDAQETDSGSPMTPGSSFTLFTAVEVPRGVASGSVGSGTLELVASAPENNP